MELIDREELIAEIEKQSEGRRGEYGDNWEFVDTIKNMPTVESRAKGKWIKDDMFECDQCHYKMIVGDGAYNFCPNCGSDMRGDNDV